MPAASAEKVHRISIAIPVYRGATTLPTLLAEIVPLNAGYATPGGRSAVVSEVLLVHDGGPDNSDVVMRELEAQYPFVKPIWLSRNFGQHAATLAGLASSGGDWIATIDEDGQYDPGQIGILLDAAMDQRASLVYAEADVTHHSAFRNLTSRVSKRVVDALTGSSEARKYHSFRLMLGEVGRSVAAYAGSGVYLDVALGWVTNSVTTAKVQLREEGDRPSGYNLKRLLHHFWSMVLTSGTRGLRFVSLAGGLIALAGLVLAIYTIVSALSGGGLPTGWASQMTVTLLLGGIGLVFLGIVAEYVGVAVNQAMGKPPYLIVSDPQDGPLGYESASPVDSPAPPKA